uniref:Uncharacterized protein n=1 Tax=Anguilla anguilla TaxID=7936 RepID=A0A0E9VM27_ANGAN
MHFTSVSRNTQITVRDSFSHTYTIMARHLALGLYVPTCRC